MNEDNFHCDKTCLHWDICWKRPTLEKALPAAKFAEVLLGATPGQRIEKAGEAAAADLDLMMHEWAGKWCPNREAAK